MKCPKNQQIWLTYSVDNKPKYLITSDVMRLTYVLYEINEDGGLNKLKTNKIPDFKEINPN